MGMTHDLKILVKLHSPPYRVHQFIQSTAIDVGSIHTCIYLGL